MEQTGDTVRVRVKVEPGPSRNHTIGQVAFTITVPEETSVEIDTNSGDITLTGIEGEANLTTRFGSVEISDVQGGPLTVNTGSGRIQASNIQTGSLDITLETDFGELNLENAAGGQAFHVVMIDYGAKRNIARHLAALGMRVTIVPAYSSCAEVVRLRPDGILLSNGPGDPAGLPRIVEVVGELIERKIPIFGICLGHQLIGRAIGGQTVRLKFGHHSGNHPVKDLRTGKVQVTSQNHNYAVAADSLNLERVEVTHLSLNDRTLEGMRLRDRPVFSVQYHPEASPGPHDAHGLFGEFYQLIANYR